MLSDSNAISSGQQLIWLTFFYILQYLYLELENIAPQVANNEGEAIWQRTLLGGVLNFQDAFAILSSEQIHNWFNHFLLLYFRQCRLYIPSEACLSKKKVSNKDSTRPKICLHIRGCELRSTTHPIFILVRPWEQFASSFETCRTGSLSKPN